MTTKQKQWQLYYLGYYGGEIDGIFGAKSKASTKAFQKDNGLQDDGLFGQKTEAKSIGIIKVIQEVVGTTVDGLAGPRTLAATIAYQKEKGLVPDGIAGPRTRAKIDESEEINWKEVRYFTRDEFKCKCGGKHCDGFPAEPSKKLVTVADRVRGHFGKPMSVNSGVRCEIHNKAVGGVSGSRHKLGKAMDFRINGYNADEILAFVKAQPEIRYAYAINSRSVHMDVE